MSRISYLRNNGSGPIKVKLTGGAEFDLPAGSELANADVANLSDLRGKADIREDLGEVGSSGGKMIINGRRLPKI